MHGNEWLRLNQHLSTEELEMPYVCMFRALAARKKALQSQKQIETQHHIRMHGIHAVKNK
jgi:hypothetical protein